MPSQLYWNTASGGKKKVKVTWKSIVVASFRVMSKYHTEIPWERKKNMSVKNRIWKAKDHEESARTTLLLLQFRIQKNISVCWIINSGRVVHVSAKVVPSTSATMDLVIRSEKPIWSCHELQYQGSRQEDMKILCVVQTTSCGILI